MKLNVKLFAKARDLAGAAAVDVELSDSACVRDLRQALAIQYPRMSALVPTLLVAIGTDYAGDETSLAGNSDVACFPPVSGG